MSAQFPMQPQPQASGATAALVLGILSLVLCPLCGPVAWALGRKAEMEVDHSGGQIGGRGIATAGKIMGIIGTLLILAVVAFIVVGIVAVGGGGDSSPSPSFDY